MRAGNAKRYIPPPALQYVVFLLFLVAAEMGLAVITFVFREEFMEGLEARLSDQLINQYGVDIANHYESNNIANKDFTTSVDFAQYRVRHCFGLAWAWRAWR